MEKLVNHQLIPTFYRGKKVFVTGHTGFKGSWLMAWLLPVVILATGSLITQRRLAACHAELVANERHGKPHP